MAKSLTNSKRATASYNSKTKEWTWESVTWNIGKDNLKYSNRHYPRKFWNYTWDKTQRDVAGVLLLRQNETYDNLEVFIVQCYKNKWGFPKGKTNKGETFIKGASREFYEETGTRIDLETATKLDINDSSKRRKIIFFYRNESPDFDIITEPIADDEITGYGWLPLEKLITYELSNVAKKVLKKLSTEIPPEFPDKAKETLIEINKFLVKGITTNKT